MERSGPQLRDWRHHPVLLGEEANRVRGPRSTTSLDPQREESEDIAREKTISKQGNTHIRSVLYGRVTAAIRNSTNPPVRDLYDRLKERGKHQKVAEGACML